MDLSAKHLSAIDELLSGGNPISAIKEYRGFTGATLTDAKAFIDRRLEQLHQQPSSRFLATPRPPAPDLQILRQIEPLPDRDLEPFRSTLGRIEKLLYGYNYAVTLSASAARLPTAELPIQELMLALFPASAPHNAKLLEASPEELVADVTQCLTYDGDATSGPQFTRERLETLTKELMPAYWQQLGALAPMDSSSILSYSSDTGLPGYYVFWFFAYLIHHPDSRRCIVITGLSSD